MSRSAPAPAALQAAEPGLGRRYRVSNVAVRVAWFDDQINRALAATSSPASSNSDDFVKVGTNTPRQVVVLGAGMDTRPWRLPLPPGAPSTLACACVTTILCVVCAAFATFLHG